jgi:hypothetical protein
MPVLKRFGALLGPALVRTFLLYLNSKTNIKKSKMKSSILFIFILTTSLFAAAQTQSPNFGTCFTKANKKSIVNKMDNFLTRVSEETNCPKEKLTYAVTEYYTVFYTKTCRHLPKKITFDACGQKRTYKHNGLSGAIFYWLLGSWTLEK